METKPNPKLSLVYALVMAVTVIISLSLTVQHTDIPLVWLPTGLATWLFLSCRQHCLYAVALGALAGVLGYFLIQNAMGGPNLKPIIAMVVAAASILVAAIVSRVIGRFLMEPNVQENRIRRFLPIVWTFIACVALSVIVVWVIRAFLGGGADNSWLAAGKLFVANGLGIVAFLPLIVGRVQLRFFFKPPTKLGIGANIPPFWHLFWPFLLPPSLHGMPPAQP